MDNVKKDTLFNFFLKFSLTLVSSILAIYLKSIGYSYEDIGFLMSLFPLMIIILLPMIGSLSDSLGKRTVLRIALFLEIIAVILYATNNLLVLARLLEGISSMTLSLVTIAMAEDHIKGKRGEKTGFLLSLGHVGKTIAAPFALFIAQFYMKSPFYLSLVILVLLLFSLKKGNTKNRSIRYDYLSSIRIFLSHRELRGMSILGIAKHASTPLIVAFIPLFLADNFGLDKAGIALFMLEFPNIFQYFFGKISDRKSPWMLVLFGLLVFSSAIFFMGSGKFIFVLMLLFIAGLGNGMWNVSAWDLMSKIGEKTHKEGTIITVYMSIAKLGSFVSYLISGIIYQNYGFSVLATINSVIIMISVLFSYPLLRK